ncbi:MAG: hypothetical protein M9928_11095 [Anaerolineae bacterium]|nr:hypothetical protein [Anaerolineae bacterium]MCO5205571.1 hypothetical protein [Anaerolineae bacterium]
MTDRSWHHPKIEVRISSTDDLKESSRKILEAIRPISSASPIIHLEVDSKDLDMAWEELPGINGPLFLEYPIHVYTPEIQTPLPQHLPLSILFTSSGENTTIEKKVFDKLGKEFPNYVDIVTETNCSGSCLVDRLREKPLHVWHHKGALEKGQQTIIELVDCSVPLVPLLKHHGVPQLVFLQSQTHLTSLGEIPLLITLATDLPADQLARLLGSFYSNLLSNSVEVATFIARLEVVKGEQQNGFVWKRLRLRGRTSVTALFLTDRLPPSPHEQLRNCLAPEQITEMASIGARHRMGDSARGMLFAFVDQEFYTRLEVHRNPRDQVESDLIALNLAAQIEDGSVPLKIWLQAAVNRLKHGSASDLRPFEKALNEVNAIIVSGSPK